MGILDDVVRYGGACTRAKICVHIVMNTEISERERAWQKSDGAMAKKSKELSSSTI